MFESMMSQTNHKEVSDYEKFAETPRIQIYRKPKEVDAPLTARIYQGYRKQKEGDKRIEQKYSCVTLITMKNKIVINLFL